MAPDIYGPSTAKKAAHNTQKAPKFIQKWKIQMAQATKAKAAAEKITAEEAERVIRFFAEQGNFSFRAYYECFKQNCECKIDNAWEIHGVTLNEHEFSFLASTRDQKPIKFMARYEALKDAIIKWLTEMSGQIKKSVKALSGQVPASIVLFAGTTEYVPVNAKAM